MATRLGNVAVGTVVKIKENGTPVDYIIVNQGLPSSLYDSSCNGTWVLRKGAIAPSPWGGNTNNYAKSAINTTLNSTFLDTIEAEIKNQIKNVIIPCCVGGTSTAINSMRCRVFLLSAHEIANFPYDATSNPFPNDGETLSYFMDMGGTFASTKRIALYNGSRVAWWVRTSNSRNTTSPYAACVGPEGGIGVQQISYNISPRPAFILDPDGLVEEDGTITYNQAPTTPGSLTVPETVLGGKPVSLSWSASTDPDGNLEGYMVERSLDGGTSWTQIYQGSALSTANTVPFGSETVRYRVKAYDSEGAASGYQTSPVRVVVNNLAPDVPEGLTLPDIVQGGAELSIIWGEATDSDGNLAGYSLERQVDGGQWTEVYNGEAANYTDSIPKGQWQTVAYRVRAYDSFGAYGGYAATETLPVNNNTPPEITSEVGADLGEKSAGFSFLYQVSDEEKDPITVTETVDDTTLRCFTVEGAEQSFSLDGEDFLVLANGSHTLKIAANDGHSGAVHEVVFTKSVTEITATLRAPMEADGQITLCVLSVNGEIPPDAVYSVMVTNNAKDASPVWEDCTAAVKNELNHIFENSAAANGFAFNFQVRAARGTSGQGGYIASIQGGFQ